MKKIFIISMLTTSVITAQAQNWQEVGANNISEKESYYISMELNSSGVPYLAYQDEDNGKKLTVRKLNGNNWATVGTNGFTADMVYDIDLAINSNDVPYVTYRTYSAPNKISVVKFENNAWVAVGDTSFSAGLVLHTSMTFDETDRPYVAYRDFGNSEKLTVKMYDGTDWVTVGTEGISGGIVTSIDIKIHQGNPYVVFQDDDNMSKATLMKYDGTTWSTVGDAGFTSNGAGYTSLSFSPSGEPYVAFQDYDSATKISVMKYNGTDWEYVGTKGFTPNASAYCTITFSPFGEPFIAFREYLTIQNSVMKFDGTDWVYVGDTSMSDGGENLSLRFTQKGQLYFSFMDIDASRVAHVMTYDCPITTPVIDRTGNILNVTTVYDSYQWKLNNENINGANAPQYTATTAGEYAVIVSNSNDCKTISDNYNYDPTSVKDLTFENSINLYPNPSNHKITIENLPVNATISIYDIYGRTVCTQQAKSTIVALDITTLPNGIYYVQIENEGKIANKKLVVNH